MKHKTALIDSKAIIHENVAIGPFTVIGPNVEIGAGTVLQSHVNISGNTKIGSNNIIYPFASLGNEPQDLKFRGEETSLEIGNNNKTVSHNIILLVFASRLIYLPSVFVFISYSDCNFIHMCLSI